jgi:uncharacterized protein (UPF0335 family)
MGRDVNKELRDIMRRLGEVINETLQESDKLKEILHEVEQRGYSLTLSLAVIVAGKEDAERRRRLPRPAKDAGEASPPKTSTFDRKFLKALRIRMPEERP